MTLTVERVSGTDGAVTVNYATANGTATAGADYTATSGTLSFADGQASRTISVPVLEDTLVEGSETFYADAIERGRRRDARVARDRDCHDQRQ